MIGRAIHQVVVRQWNIGIVGLGDAGLKIENINLFDGGADLESICQAIIDERAPAPRPG